MSFIHFSFLFFFVEFSTSVGFSSNPVSSVIYLILSFVITAFISFCLNLDFFGLIFVVIYVGAIAVLFLFIIMMLDIKDKRVVHFLEFSLLFGCFLFFVFDNFVYSGSIESFSSTNFSLVHLLCFDSINNIDFVGMCLYNEYLICFLISGLILFAALLGSVVLTLSFDSVNSAQNYFRQLARADLLPASFESFRFYAPNSISSGKTLHFKSSSYYEL